MTILTTFANGGSLKDYRDTFNDMLAAIAQLKAGAVTPTPSTGNFIIAGDSIPAGLKIAGYDGQTANTTITSFGWPQRMGYPSAVTRKSDTPLAISGTWVVSGQAGQGIAESLGASLFAPYYVPGVSNVLVVERQINDIGGGLSAATIAAEQRRLIGVAKSQGFYVGLQTPLPRGGASTPQEQVRQALIGLQRADMLGADFLIDMAADPVMGPMAATSDASLYQEGASGQGLHPADAGMNRIRDVYRPLLSAWLLLSPRLPATPSAYVGTPLILSTSPAAAFGASVSGFGSQMTGGYASTAPGSGGGASPGGTPAGSTWTEEAFVTFPSAAPSNVEVPWMQGGRFVVAQASNGRLEVRVDLADASFQFFGGGDFGGGGSLPIVTGRHHIRISSKPGTQTLEVDGSTVATLSIATPATTNDANGRCIRGLTNNSMIGQFPFSGSIDELAVFNTYRAGLAVPTAPYTTAATGIVELWHLDGNGAPA